MTPTSPAAPLTGVRLDHVPTQQHDVEVLCDPTWLVSAHRVRAWVSTHTTLPSLATCADTSLVGWLNHQRIAAQGRGPAPLPAEHRAWLDIHLPGWLPAKPDPAAVYRQRLDALVRFRQSAGRWPRSSGAFDAGEAEASLFFLEVRRRARGRGPALTGEQVAELDAVLPGWNEPATGSQYMSAERRWLRTAQDVAAFVTEHGRLPRINPPDTNPLFALEGHLGSWLANQRKAAKPGAPKPLFSDRRSWLNEHVPGWDTPDAAGTTRGRRPSTG